MKKYKIHDQRYVTLGYKTGGCLVYFGGGADFHINENCSQNIKSYSTMGYSYGKQEGATARSLTKEKYFTVKELELYLVKLT